MSDQTTKCPICNRPYKFYPHLCKDQSACPACVEEAERNTEVDIADRVPSSARNPITGKIRL